MNVSYLYHSETETQLYNRCTWHKLFVLSNAKTLSRTFLWSN